jgi:hypothetical protein
MYNTATKRYLLIILLVFFLLLTTGVIGCVSPRQALELEKGANCAIMKNLQDNDQDLFQIEDGTGTIGEATACPT